MHYTLRGASLQRCRPLLARRPPPHWRVGPPPPGGVPRAGTLSSSALAQAITTTATSDQTRMDSSMVNAGHHGRSPYQPEKLGNLRDLASALPGVIRPGLVMRCANPAESSPRDVEWLLNDVGLSVLVRGPHTTHYTFWG